MIPKTIHYCWFGKGPKNDKILQCLESWRKVCPDFEIVEWDESNFAYNDHPFTKRVYAEKRWAFVSDYARLFILEKYGGFYLDTDMLLLKSLSPLTDYECVLGEEDRNVISAGMIGAIPNHPFIKSCKNFYDEHQKELITIPRVLSKVFSEYENKKSLKVLPPKVFYPFDSAHIKNYHGQDLGAEVIGIHLWNYSWGHPLNKAFKRFGIYAFGKRVAEFFGIKKIIKKLLGFI